MKILLHTLPCILALVFAASSHAEILAVFDFENSNPIPGIGNTTDNQTSDNTVNVAGISVSPYNTLTNQGATQNSGGIRTVIDTEFPHAYARGSVTQNILPATHAELLTNDVVFHEFTVEVQQGVWTLDRLHFDYWVDQPENNTNYAATVYSDLVGGQLDSQAPQIPDDPALRNKEFSLASLSGISLTAGQTANFRVAFTDNANSGNAIHRIDNVVLEGTNLSAVPEPAAATILLLVGGIAATRRRRS
jgi:hypothetical protein